MSDVEIIRGENYHYLRVRGLILELVSRQRGRLLSIRRAHLFLCQQGLKVKSAYIRDVFLSLKMVKDCEGEDGQKERYRIPDSLSNAP